MTIKVVDDDEGEGCRLTVGRVMTGVSGMKIEEGE